MRSDGNHVLLNTVTSYDVGIELIESDSNFVRLNILEDNGECILETDSVGNHFIQNVCIP